MKEYDINELNPIVRRHSGFTCIKVSPLEITLTESPQNGGSQIGTVGFVIPHNIVQVAPASKNYDDMMRYIASAIESETSYEVAYLAAPK